MQSAEIGCSTSLFSRKNQSFWAPAMRNNEIWLLIWIDRMQPLAVQQHRAPELDWSKRYHGNQVETLVFIHVFQRRIFFKATRALRLLNVERHQWYRCVDLEIL